MVRPGAGTIHFAVWDIEVDKLCEIRREASGEERVQARDLFPCVVIDDVFMERCESNEEYTLFDPKDVRLLNQTYGDEFRRQYLKYEEDFKNNPNNYNVNTKVVKARDIMKVIIKARSETGTPFLFFKDNVNRQHKNPQLGIIRQSNLCFTGDTKVHVEYNLDNLGNTTIAGVPGSAMKDIENKDLTLKELTDYSNGCREIKVDSSKYDEETSTWVSEHKTAVAFKTGNDKEYIKLILSNGDQLSCTPDHPFALKDGTYLEAIKLKGKELITKSGNIVRVTDYSTHESFKADVFDLSVTDNHNFYVKGNNDSYLVHNCVNGKTRILTKEYGYVQIGGLVQKGIKEVTLWNGKEWSKGEVFSTGTQKTYFIYFSNGVNINATKEHIWYVNDNGSIVKKTTAELRKDDIIEDMILPIINHGDNVLENAYESGMFNVFGKSNNDHDLFVFNKISDFKYVDLLENYEEISKTKKFSSKETIRTVKYNKGKLLNKYEFPGNDVRLEDKLLWLAGLIDSAGTLQYTVKGVRLVINTTEFDFANDLCLYLQELGIYSYSKQKQMDMSKMPKDSKGNVTMNGWSSSIDVIPDLEELCKLIDKGLKLKRLDISNIKNFIPVDKVIKVESAPFEEDEHSHRDENGEPYGIEEETFCATEPLLHKVVFNGVLSGNCNEIYQPTSPEETAVCNLGSFNIAKIGNDLERAKYVAKLAVRICDNSIDMTEYPSEDSRKTQLARRSCGLGQTGNAEWVAVNKFVYGSEEHQNRLEELQKVLHNATVEATKELAVEKGSCVIEGVRNAYLHAIAPNSSSGIFASTTNSHEPTFEQFWIEGNKYDKTRMTAPNIKPDNKNYYISVFDLDMKTHIKMTSILQKYVDMGISTNLYYKPEDLTISRLYSDIHYAWKCNLKGLYYSRTKSQDNSSVEALVDGKIEKVTERNGIKCVGCEN
ncbi:polymorphic toxin-type HINT domain-containing protein [Campylobacter coli]